MPGFPVHQLPELAQTHVHRVVDATQPSHPLSSPSPPSFSSENNKLTFFSWQFKYVKSTVQFVRYSFQIYEPLFIFSTSSVSF